MTARLSPQSEAAVTSLVNGGYAPQIAKEIVSRVRAEAAEEARTAAAVELAAVRAERDEALEQAAACGQLRIELAKYLCSEPTIAEEVAFLNRCLDAVYALCDEAEAKGITSGGMFTVDAVRDAADGVRPDNPKDRRRRIYIDGKGNGWIDLNRDEATGEQNVTGLTDQWQIKSTDEVAEATGSIREIGRCW